MPATSQRPLSSHTTIIINLTQRPFSLYGHGARIDPPRVWFFVARDNLRGLWAGMPHQYNVFTPLVFMVLHLGTKPRAKVYHWENCLLARGADGKNQRGLRARGARAFVAFLADSGVPDLCLPGIHRARRAFLWEMVNILKQIARLGESSAVYIYSRPRTGAAAAAEQVNFWVGKNLCDTTIHVGIWLCWCRTMFGIPRDGFFLRS